MDSTRQDIVVVWFKRDIRLIDHEPIMLAQEEKLPILFVYCFEPSIMGYDDSDERHWRFVYESLQDLQTKLLPYNTQVAIFCRRPYLFLPPWLNNTISKLFIRTKKLEIN